MTSPVPVKRAKRSRTLASATPVSSAISESSRWPYFCRHCRMSIKVSLPLLDAIVAMNPGDENLHLASAARRRHGRWCHMSSLRAPSDTLASRSTTRWRSRSKLRCNLAGLVATAEPDGRRPAKSKSVAATAACLGATLQRCLRTACRMPRQLERNPNDLLLRVSTERRMGSGVSLTPSPLRPRPCGSSECWRIVRRYL